ncbi:MAG: YdcF family protein, partial [Anaerolineaceae bacterium]|nr:YdcF family protein [Anaerolineaceae bacterium]
MALVLIILISGNRWFSMILVRSLEWQYLPAVDLSLADCIVVLGGGTEPQAFPRSTVELNSAGDRVLYAADLFHQGKAPMLLLSGGSISWMDTSLSTPADEMAEIMKRLSVPDDVILLEEKSLNTYENALYSKEILMEKGIGKIILVTSAMHMPRSVAA